MLSFFDALRNLACEIDNDADWKRLERSFIALKKKETTLSPINIRRTTILDVAIITLVAFVTIFSFLTSSILGFSVFPFPLIHLFVTLMIIKYIHNIAEPLEKIGNWMKFSCDEIGGEIGHLTQVQIKGTKAIYERLLEDRSRLENNREALLLRLAKIRFTPIKQLTVLIKESLPDLEKVSKDIYSIRGKIDEAMAIMLQYKKVLVSNKIRLEEAEKKEFYENIIKGLEDKSKEMDNKIVETNRSLDKSIMDRTVTIEHILEEGKKKMAQQTEDMAVNWGKRLKEFEEKIDRVYNSNYNRFGTLNKQLQEQYTRFYEEARQKIREITANMSELFVDKFLQESAKKDLDSSYFKDFRFIADLHLADILKTGTKERILEALNGFCDIHDMILTTKRR